MVAVTFHNNETLLNTYFQSKDIKLRNQIIELNMGLVYDVASKMSALCNLPKDELIQIGATGLIKAVERFSPERKRKLSSYAIPFIRGAILMYLRDKGRLVRVPRNLHQTYQKINRYAQKHGLLYEQAANSLGISLEDAQEAYTICNQFNPDVPESISVESQEEFESIAYLLDKLPETHAAIIRGLYIDNTPIKILCQTHGLSIRKIKTIETEAVKELKLIALGRAKCPSCGSHQTIKYGKRDGKQGYLCKSCQVQFRENPLPNGRRGYDDDVKLKAVQAINEGRSSYWCETYLGVDHSTAHLWAKNYVIDNSITLSKKQMATAQAQWQIANKFTGLADYLIKSCPESPELEEALKLLNQSMQHSQKAIEAAKK